MHKTAAKLMFGDFFLNFWLRRPNEDKEFENKTTNLRQLGLGHAHLPYPTRRSPLPSGPGGGLPSPLGGHRRPPANFRHARLSIRGRAS